MDMITGSLLSFIILPCKKIGYQNGATQHTMFCSRLVRSCGYKV